MKDWKEIERIFHLALQEELGRRESFLARESADPEILEEVRALLETYSQAEEFLENPVLQLMSRQSKAGDSTGELRKDLSDNSVTPGRVVSHYRILDKLGQGGMGEVFLAEDLSLERKVALKFLPGSLIEDDVARKRLLREAKTVAALEHPYICHINEVAEADGGQDFIVMEYIQGQTLKDRLSESVLPVRDVLRIASEVAEALECAHNAGIVHRDLKPGNIMFTSDGHAKVMDFGLAKRFSYMGEPGSGISSELTGEGATVGTLAYMSPEQIQARKLDHRSDIFSLGIVIFEMLAQVHPFRRSSRMETAGAILREDPPSLSRAGERLPGNIQETVRRMLYKDPGDRPQSIAEVRSRLEEAVQALGATPGELWRRIRWALPWRRILPWALVPLAAVLGVFGTVWFIEEERPWGGSPRVHSEVPLPAGQRLTHWFRHGLAISPDSRYLAFVADEAEQNFSSQSFWQPKQNQIFVRRLDQWSIQPVPGTERGFQPVFSPDGRWLCFVQLQPVAEEYLLKKIALDGGQVTTLCETGMPFGACWGPDGIIYAEKVGGLLSVPSNGGTPQRITELDEESLEVSHRLPHLLPDNQGILFTSLMDPNPDWRRATTWVQSFETGKRKKVLEGGSDARYLPSGHLVYASEGSLMAVPFDLDELEVTGDPVTVVDHVSHSVQTGGEWQEVGASQFVVSTDGLLAYEPGSVFPEPKFSIVWVDRQGREERLSIEQRKYVRVRVSPDGRRLLLAHFYSPGGLWAYDLERKLLRRQTFRGPSANTVWGPKQGYFTYSADTQGVSVKRVDTGPGVYERLPAGSSRGRSIIPGNWDPTGKWLAGVTFPGTADIWLVSTDGESKAFFKTGYREEFPDFSPDGKWLVYTSTESGQAEVYVRAFPGPGTAVQISTEGGYAAGWARDGKEIFYRAFGGGFRAVRIQAENGQLRVGLPEELFEGDYPDAFPTRAWDIAPDGRFLLIKDMDDDSWRKVFEEAYPDRIRIEQNWLEELETLVP